MPHWTEESTDNFVYKISADFIRQLEQRMEIEPMSPKELASKLGVSVGRISQILNNPGNFTLKKIVEYARALGMKVSVVAYDDGDPENHNGPVNSEIFQICWENAGKPADFFNLSYESWIVKRFNIQGRANSEAQIIPYPMRLETTVSTDKEQAYA